MYCIGVVVKRSGEVKVALKSSHSHIKTTMKLQKTITEPPKIKLSKCYTTKNTRIFGQFLKKLNAYLSSDPATSF